MSQHPHTRLDTPIAAQPLTPAGDMADALAALRQRTIAVRAIGAALGLDDARLARGEALDRLEVTATLPADDVLAWPADHLREPFAILDADLAFDLTLAGAESLSAMPLTATLRASNDPTSALAAFQRAAADLIARQGDDLTVEARLAVAKRDALAVMRPLADTAQYAPPIAVTVFYFTAAWERLLTLADLPLWSQRGLLPAEARALVLLGDAAGHLAGPALEIIGAATPAPLRPLPISRAAWRQFTDRAATYARLRDEEGHWSAPPLLLTPAHLAVATRAPGLETTALRLATLRAALAAAYLASATAGSWESGLELRFAGARPATCLLTPDSGKNGNLTSAAFETGGIGDPTATSSLRRGVGPTPALTESPAPDHRNPGRIGNIASPDSGLTSGKNGNAANQPPHMSGKNGNAGSLDSAHMSGRIGNIAGDDAPHISGRNGNAERATGDLDPALARLARWAFTHGSPDKLAIARECLARELPAGAAITLTDLERAALPALDAAKANFALYLRGRTEQYFKLRQSAQDAVATYAETVRKTVADLASDAVESLYRTAGLAVGLILAWLIQPAASLWLVRLGALLYTIYVAFILRLILPAREERYRLESAALAHRLADLPELTAAERAHLREAASGDDTYFTRYLVLARRITWGLLILGVLVLLGFCLIPLAQHLLAAPTNPPHPRGGR